MRNWSINLALNVGIMFLVILCVVSLCTNFFLMALNDLIGWPLYITFPLGLIGCITIIVLGFQSLGKFWVPWIYLNVIDVVEFEKAASFSGFLAYPVESIKDEHKRSLIEARFKDYQFYDDLEVPYETVIYFHKTYQRIIFLMIMGCLGLYLLILILSPYLEPQLIVPLIVGAIVYVLYNKYIDKSPQIILSENGIEIKGVYYLWEQVTSYFIKVGQQSYLYIDHNDGTVEIQLDNSTIGKRKLNHLLHIYYYRHKMKISTQM